jgi:hypothetical protein
LVLMVRSSVANGAELIICHLGVDFCVRMFGGAHEQRSVA